MRFYFFLVPLFFLSACVHHYPQNNIGYICDNDMQIKAEYFQNHVKLLIEGKSKLLYRTVSASGAKYATEDGLTTDSGLIWWEKGNEVTLFEMTLDHTVKSEDYQVITECRAQE